MAEAANSCGGGDGIVRRTPPTDADVAAAEEGGSGGGLNYLEKDYYTDDEDNCGGSEDAEANDEEAASSVSNIIKVTVSQRSDQEEAFHPEVAEAADEGEAEAAGSDVPASRDQFSKSTVASDPRGQAKVRLPAAQVATAGAQPNLRRARLIQNKEPIFFKSLPRRRPTIPRDPFSKNRQFKLVKPAPVIIRQTRRRKLTFIDPAYILRRRQEKREAKHTRMNPELQLASSTQLKRVAFAKKVTIHGENDEALQPQEEPDTDGVQLGADYSRESAESNIDAHATFEDEIDRQDQRAVSADGATRPPPMPLPPLPHLPTPPLPQLRSSRLTQPPPSRGAAVRLGLGQVAKMKSRAPPAKRRQPQISSPASSAEAAATNEAEEIAAAAETPLDYLSRYCIVHAHRLPAYEAAFRRAVAKQPFRYEPYKEIAQQAEMAAAAAGAPAVSARSSAASSRATASAASSAVVQEAPPPVAFSGSAAEISAEELYHRQLQCRVGGGLTEAQLTQLTRQLQIGQLGPSPNESFLSPCDAELSKQRFIFDRLLERQARHQSEAAALESEREGLLSRLALARHPEVLAQPLAAAAAAAARSSLPMQPPMAAHHLLTPRQLAAVEAMPEAQRQAARLERCRQLAEHVDNRLAETRESIRRLATLGSRELIEQQLRRGRQRRGGLEADDEEEVFLREQSLIYQRLRPDIDLELNADNLEAALSEVNGHLISRRELQYVHRLLRLPGRGRLNFRLFSIVAALSEKIVQLEPILRKLINKLDFEALDFKVERCRELFRLLESAGPAPPGCVPVEGLAVELLAGNLKDEHVGSVLRKLTREKKGYIDFLEFLTYVPLFLEIHQRIVADPLSSYPQW